MDRAARLAADQPFPLIIKLVCPTCGTRDVGEGCLCLGNERTCINGHHMVRCQTKHEGLLVAIPPSAVPNQHCFQSWGIKTADWPVIKSGERKGYHNKDAILTEPCECEAAPQAWAKYNATPQARDAQRREPAPTTVAQLVGTGIIVAFVVWILVYS